jgi:hypothetical protein
MGSKSSVDSSTDFLVIRQNCINQTSGSTMFIRKIISVISFSMCSHAIASTSFKDTEFDLTHYDITTYQSKQTITATNPAAVGAPGAALQVLFSSLGGKSFGRAVFVNNTFAYDPGREGKIDSISFSSDNLINAGVPLAAFSTNLLISQGGQLYQYGISLTTSENIYQHAQSIELLSTNFNLVTNFNSSAVSFDSTIHPDFSSGLMYFGFYRHWVDNIGYGAHNTIQRLDNFSITVTSVPEPTAYALALVGLLTLAAAKRRVQ